MLNKIISSSIFIIVALILGACSNGTATKYKRGPEFFDRLINSSTDFDRAEEKLSELKLITSSEKYKMRYALFDNGKFYYEVDNLGHGTGKWSYRDGALNLFASRSFFDMDLNLMAMEAEGDAMSMQFLDRFGTNTVKVQFRPVSAKPLRHFSSHSSGSL